MAICNDNKSVAYLHSIVQDFAVDDYDLLREIHSKNKKLNAQRTCRFKVLRTVSTIDKLDIPHDPGISPVFDDEDLTIIPQLTPSTLADLQCLSVSRPPRMSGKEI